jgi:hypothetical protein
LSQYLSGLQSVRTIAQASTLEFGFSKQKQKRIEILELLRMRRECSNSNIGFASRPFVLCGLPVKRPAKGALLHERRNGKFLSQVTGHPQYGVPWGQDRLVPIFLATLAVRQQSQRIKFRSAAEMLDLFGMQQGGSQYRRPIAAFQRVFGATIFFGTDTQRDKARVMQYGRFNFMREARIWYSRELEQEMLPGGFENEIVLSDEFYRESIEHPIPTDLEAAKALSCSPAALDLFMWLSYRCFTATSRERVSFFGEFGLASQLGSAEYARSRKFRERLDCWLDLVRALWPACAASISSDGNYIWISPALAVAKEA